MHKVTRYSVVFLAMATAAVFAIACGGHQTASPTAPSVVTPSVAGPGPAATAGATISGTIVGGATTFATTRMSAFSAPMTVVVTGTTSSATVDASGHFILQNVPVGHVDLHFTGNGADAHLGLDDVVEHATITITVVVNGSSARLDTGQRDEPDNRIEIEGLVTATSASTLTVNGKMITVNAATVIVHGDQTIAFASIRSGDRVHVKGSPTTIGGLAAILATKIEVQNVAVPPIVTPPPTTPPTPSDDDGKDGGHGEAEVSGAVTSKTGACPAISFKIGTTSVTTSAKTAFKGSTCATLANGTKVEVTGAKQITGVVLASRVQADE